MAIHEELKPDDAALPYLMARANRLMSTDNSARTAGTIIVPNLDGTDTVLGVNGVAPWVGDTTPPGRPLDIEATSHLGTALIRWGGELEGGIPSDFRCVQIWAKQVGATADEKTLVGVLSSAGEVNTGVFAAGTTLDVWATALDNAHDRDGSPAFNESVESEHMQVEILPIVSQQEFDEAADNILAAADESVKAQIERVDADLAATNEAIDQKAGETLAAANAAAEANLNRVQEEIAGEGGKIAQAANGAYERSKDYTDGIKEQVDADLVATGNAIDAAADKVLADAKADTAKHIEQVNKDIDAAGELIAANKNAVETEARLRAEGDKAAYDAAAAVAEETDKLKTKYDTMDTDVKSVKSDLTKVMSSTTQLEQDMIVSTLIEYAVGDSDTVPPDLATYWLGEPNNSVSVLSDPWGPTTPERTPGTYIWMRTRVTFGDGGQETSAPVLVTGNTGTQGVPGPQGVAGAQGVSVSALTPFWQLAESKPAQPVNKAPGGGWTSTEPAYVRGKKLWTCSRIDYSNGQWSWTSVQQSSAFEAAELALTTANGKNRRYVQPSTPVVDTSELTQGDEWWQTSTKPPETYWLGEPNNSVSVLVDHSGDVEHIWVWNGTRWALNRLSAEDILVSGTVAAGLVTADFFDGARIKGGEFLTSNELIRLNNAGLIMNGKSGERLVTLNATDGTATFNSVSITNGALNAGTIEGAAINGGSFTLRDKDGRAIGHLNSSGMDLGDVLSFAKKDGEWQLSIKGGIKAGSTISGASIVGDSTVTGGVVQTTPAANRGIKLAGGNLDIYRSDEKRFLRANENGLYISDGSRNVLSFSRVWRTYWEGEPNNSVSVLSDPWQLTLDGAIQAGGEITGAVITGGTVQTNAAPNKGLKLKDNNLDAYMASGTRFLRLNEAGLWFNDGSADVLSFTQSNGAWKLRLTGAIQAGGAISGATVTGSTVQTTASANRGVKLYSGDDTTGNLDVYRADGKLFFRVNEDGLSVKDSDTNLLSFAKVNNAWKLSLKGAIQSGGEISGAAITGAVIRTNTEWQSSEAAKKYRGLVITDGGMFAYKGNGKKEYSMAFTAATGELKLDGAVAANASLTGATINGGVVYGATVTTNQNYASTDPKLRDRGVWIKSNGLVAYNASNLETVRIDAASGRLWTRDGISTNGAFSVLDMSERPLLKLGADTNGHTTFTIYTNDLDPAIDRRRLQYVDHTSNNHRTFSLWGNNNVAYQTQTGWDSARVQSPCVDLGLQTARRGGLVVFRGRVSAPNSGDNTLIANIGLVAGEAATKWAHFETYGTNRSAVAVGFRNNTVQPCIVYIPANTRQLVAMNGPWDWVDLTGVTFGQ